MNLIGKNYIGGGRSSQNASELRRADAYTGEALPYHFGQASSQEAELACVAAGRAFAPYPALAPQRRGGGLMRLPMNLMHLIMILPNW